jgi:hypothetical protein
MSTKKKKRRRLRDAKIIVYRLHEIKKITKILDFKKKNIRIRYV